MKRNHIILASVAVIALIAATAGASALVTRTMMSEDKPALEKVAEKPAHKSTKKEQISWNEPRHPVQQQAAAPQPKACDDANIIGTVVGGLGGGVAGSQVGKGSGKTAATIGGTLGGAYLGNQFIPTRNVTCAK